MTPCSTTVTIPRILSIKEAMKIFGMGRPTIDAGIQSGELPAYRPNMKQYLLDATEVLEWIKKRKYDSGYRKSA